MTHIRANGGLMLKQYTYGTANAGADYRLGKLIQSDRFNRPMIGATLYNATVRELFTYAADQGRVSLKETRLTFNGTTSDFCRQSYVYDDLGQVSSLTYPNCVFAACASSPRTVSFTRSRGRLTVVPGWATALSYHANGLVNQVTHSNGVVFTQANDPNGMARPASLTSTFGVTTHWTSGSYGYDGSGNIKLMGFQQPYYDSLSRITSSGLLPGDQWQAYTYDNYGNRTSVTTNGVLVNEPTSTATNRLTGGSYDSAGNLTWWNGNTYEYDDFNMLKRSVSGSEEWLHMYTANDERFWAFKVQPAGSGLPRFDHWTLRDLDGKVLREYRNLGYTFSTFEDYIHRDGPLLASVLSSGEQRHFDLDHLGSVRVITNAAGSPTLHRYWPYGKEFTAIAEAERMKFAGHERDLGSLAGDGDDLDYMHARHYSPVRGRLLSVDPVLNARAALGSPGHWNRYSYAANNPIKNVDPDGKESVGVMAADRDTRELIAGKITTQEFNDRLNARGAGALIGVGLLAAAVAGEAAVTAVATRAPELFIATAAIGQGLIGGSSPRVVIPGPTNSALGKLDYLLGLVPGKASSDKGGLFAGSLGFTKDSLAAALHGHLIANLGNATQTGSRVVVTAAMTGANGQVRTVVSIWQILTDGSYSFITAYQRK